MAMTGTILVTLAALFVAIVGGAWLGPGGGEERRPDPPMQRRQ